MIKHTKKGLTIELVLKYWCLELYDNLL